MTSLQNYYDGHTHIHIPITSKDNIHRAIFSHIKNQTLDQKAKYQTKSLRYRIGHYQAQLSPRYLYASIVIGIIIGSVYIFDVSPQTKYKSLGPLITTETISPNHVYAQQLGTIISTVGEVDVFHQGQVIDSTKLYGNDTILLSNQSYIIFTLAGGYIGSVSGPAKIELHRVGDTYKINVIDGNIFTLKSQNPSPAKIQISTTDFVLTPQGSTDLVIAKDQKKMLVQNHATSDIIVKDTQPSNHGGDQQTLIISQESVHIAFVDGIMELNPLGAEEAKILIAELKNGSISATYDIEPGLLSQNILSDIQDNIGSQSGISGTNVGVSGSNDSSGITIDQNHHTIILATLDQEQIQDTRTNNQDIDTIGNISTNLNTLIEQTKNTIDQTSTRQASQEKILSSDEIGLEDVAIKPLLQHDASMRIIKMLGEIRNNLDTNTPNIDLINDSIKLISQSLLMTAPTISNIDQLPQSIATFEKELSTYSIDPKITHQINRFYTAYQRYHTYSQQSSNVGTDVSHHTNTGSDIDQSAVDTGGIKSIEDTNPQVSSGDTPNLTF